MRMQRFAENYYLSLPLSMILVFLPLLNWLGLTWAVFAVLRQNIYLGALAMAAVGFAGFYAISGMQFNSTLAEWAAFLTLIGPLWAMAYSLRVFRSLRLSLQLGYGLLVLLALLNYGVYGPGNYEDLYQGLSQRLFAGELSSDDMMHKMQQMYLQTMASTALYAWPAMLMLFQVLLLVSGRYIQGRWYNPGGFQLEFHALQLSKWMSLPLLLSFLWAIFAPEIQVAVQLAGLSALLYSIAGIAWIHWYIKARQLGKMWVVLFYGVLFVLSAWALPLLAVIALLDSHLDLRARLKR